MLLFDKSIWKYKKTCIVINATEAHKLTLFYLVRVLLLTMFLKYESGYKEKNNNSANNICSF